MADVDGDPGPETADGVGPSPDPDPGGADRTAVALDALLLLSVPAILLAVHYLAPTTLRDQLALHHASPAPATFVTSAYVHANDAHLYGNLTGYAIGALYAYGLALQAGRRRWFRRTFLALVLVLPVPVNAASMVAFGFQYPGIDPVSRGFSGVVGGLVGVVLVSLVAFLRSQYDPRLGRAVGAAVVLVLLLEVDYIYAGRLRPPIVALVIIGLAAVGHGIVARGYPPSDVVEAVEPPRDTRRLGDALLVVLVVAVLGSLVANLFPPPASLVSDGGFTDVFAHATGIVGGGVIAVAVAHLTPERSASPGAHVPAADE